MYRTTLYILAAILTITNLAKSDEVIGCGGFIRSTVKINYSRVEVKLLTKQGSHKYQTEGAPNNGYYLIPLYDKGEYVLKVEPPPGWIFEPASVDLRIDGSTDPCSTSKDIDFVFKGFSVTGKVVSHGLEEGPAGVTVELQGTGNSVLHTTVTGAGGAYTFSKILPGDYSLVASHPTWAFKQAKLSVKVADDNGRVARHLAVAGYDVRGEVVGEGDPVRGVHFVLTTDSASRPTAAPEGCVKSAPRGFALPAGLRLVCHVTSGEDGQFVFPTVAPGSYRLLPFYKAERIEFDMAPKQAAFSVGHGSYRFPAKFQVQGFSVSGKVLESPSGPGVAQAEVYLGGAKAATTDASGGFQLENMKAGQYVLQVRAGGMSFDPFPVRVSPNTPELPPITASRFEVCGTIEGGGRRVVVEGGAEPVSATADARGRFCATLETGKYVLRPFLTKEEEAAGLRFVPSELPLVLPSAKKADVSFVRFRAEIQGTVVCVGKCGSGLKVFLRAAGSGVDADVTAEVKSDESFSFSGLVVGKYQLSANRPDWCWEHGDVKIHSVDRDVSNVVLRQSGFKMAISSSHATKVQMVHSDGALQSLSVPAGSSTHCLSKKGVYAVKTVGCHEFEEKNILFDTTKPATVVLTASKHSVGGVVVAEENVTDLVVSASASGAAVVSVPLANPVPHAENQFLYRFAVMLPPNANVEIVPRSGRLLFNPPTFKLLVGDDCSKDEVRFNGRIGLFVDGRIHPPLGGVKVVVRDLGGHQPEVETVSDAAGKFLVGPLDSESKYDVQATREGYVLKPLGKLGHFEAFKFSEVNVAVVDAAGRALSGVLVSLSGGVDYRNNSRTREDGKLHFPNLSPGNYFLRPMMKEYRFTPPSKMVAVGEGATVDVRVTGERVAFSCMGSVSSITGEAEAGVALEALGTGSCQGHQEEAQSDPGGAFRIRGLLPGCTYRLRLKQDANPHVERAAPPERLLQVTSSDLTDVRVIVFRFFGQMDVTGKVVTEARNLPNLKVRLVADDAPEQTVHVGQLGPGGFFLLPPLARDGRSYCLQLEGGTGGAGTTGTSCFRANSSHRHLSLSYAPEAPQHADHDVVARSSLLALPVTVALLVACYHSSRILGLVSDLVGVLRGLAKGSENPTGSPLDSRRKAKARRT
ncbi:nodal modulator 3 [Ixodes scapularis]|uniref:nodal modulator 3 n=1 Tax=Ixodes scapularis TaxID=6945 RepID=UPI001C386AB2|nr:nodal modulator 3 [Ixodes scapularis]